MTKIKLCGLTRIADVDAVNEIFPDYAGFVFAPGRRRLPAESARRLIAALDRRVAPVGVFCDETPEVVVATVNLCGLGVVQLHGSEDDAYLTCLREWLPPHVSVWKALRVRSADTVTRGFSLAADGFVLDAWHPGIPGGTGKVFDWELVRGVETPYLLAGGLTPENVGAAICALRPLGVDASSGIETGSVKDPARMRAFVEAVRRADRWVAENGT